VQHCVWDAPHGNLFTAYSIKQNGLGIGFADIENGNMLHGI
jgi:hypothetical protein